MELVNPLRTILADLLNLPSVQVDDQKIEVSKSLKELTSSSELRDIQYR